MESENNISSLWNKLKATLTEETIANLNSGASEKEIHEFEILINYDLPSEFKNFLKAHNGQKYNSKGIFNSNQFLSLQDIKSNWLIWKELLEAGDFDSSKAKSDVQIQNIWWDIGWIPFTDNGSGDHFCLDLNPTENGTYGQIIQVWHDTNRRICVADNFSDWISFNFINKV